MLPHVSVDLSGFQALRQQTRIAAIGLCKRAAREGAKRGLEEAKVLAPVGTYYGSDGEGRSGGRLKREITAFFDRPLPFGEQWELQSPTPYARYVEEGTRAHWIHPKAARGSRGPLLPGQSRRKASDVGVGRGSFLRWWGPDGVHFARSVYHPGTTAQPFMANAGEHARMWMIEEVRQGFVSIASRWN